MMNEIEQKKKFILNLKNILEKLLHFLLMKEKYDMLDYEWMYDMKKMGRNDFLDQY